MSKEHLYQTSKQLKSFWVSQLRKVSDIPTKKVINILKFQIACNYSVNLNFDMQYLGNARLD